MLGPPGRQQLVLGMVNGPGAITVNLSKDKQPLRDSGYRDYVFDVWFSPTITIQAFVDADDRVACRYSSGGRSQTLLARMWHKKSVTLAFED